MRKVLPYIILSAAFALLLCGCKPENLGAGSDEDGIVLYFNSGSNVPLTKAYSSSVTAYNENKISTVDIFFYPEGVGATTSNAVYSVIGRSVTQVNDSTYRVSIRTNNEQMQAIFGGTVNGSCKVFVIANASLSYSDTSIPSLKQQVIERDFSTQTVQGSFVMYSRDGGSETEEEGYTIVLSGGTASGKVPMLRVAAKAQLFFKVIDSIEDPNTHLTWKPDLAHMKVYLVNGMKRTKISAPYTPSIDGSDYFDYPERDVTDYSLAASGTTEKEVYTEISGAGFGSYKYSCAPFYSYPCSWKDIHDHATQYIIDVPWYLDTEGAAPPASRYYQLSANLVDSWFRSNSYYRSFVEIKTLGGADKIQSVDIQDCTYTITPWFTAGADVESGVPVVGTFESQSYLVVEPTKIILNNENYAEFNYLSSSTLDAVNTKVIEVRYYDYKNGGKEQIRRTADTNPSISSDSNTNSTAISVDISQSGKVKVTHNLYNNDGSQKIFVEYYIKLRIQNGDGLHEDVEIIQYPPLYVLMKNGGNAFVDGYFRFVQKTGGGAPFTNAYAYTGISQWNGYYRSVSYYSSPASTTKDQYWYLGTRPRDNNDDFTSGQSVYMVVTPYGNLAGKPGDTTLSLYDITGLKLSAFSSSYHSYTVGIGTNGSGAVSQEFEYRVGDPRVDNDFTDSPKLVDYLTGMGSSYTTQQTYRRRYNSSNVTTNEWGTLADQVKIGTTSHENNTLIAPYILISSSHLGQLSLNSETNNWGVTYEQAKRRCATYQEGGYPAGRWRLPTEAEIMFIVERQRNNDINTLFNDSSTSYYWAASGYYYCNGNLYQSTNSARAGAARCVYDAWYWGDDPVAAAAYTYTPMPN